MCPGCEYEKEADSHRGIAHAGDDKRLDSGAPVCRILVPKAYEQVAAEPDTLPPKVEKKQIIGHDEGEHRADEEIHIREKAAVTFFSAIMNPVE